MKRDDVLMVLPSLNYGGAERVFLNTANYLADNGNKVTLCVVTESDDEFLSKLSDNVNYISLNRTRVAFSFFSVLFLLYKRKPKVIYSTLWHMNVVVGFSRLFYFRKSKFILREANIISNQVASPLTRILIRFSYSKFDEAIAQSQEMKEDMQSFSGVPIDRIHVIGNGVDIKTIGKTLDIKAAPQKNSVSITKMLCIGKLEHQKGFDLLLKTLGELKGRLDFRLKLIGVGSCKEELLYLISKYELNENVVIIDRISKPASLFMDSDVFISPSRYEGFPNVVVESLCCGTPVIANRYRGGISEILSEEIFGEIIDITNPEELFNSINKVRSLSKKEIEKKAVEAFSLDKMMHKVEALLLG